MESLSFILQITSLVFEAIGIPLALIEIHNKPLAKRIEKWITYGIELCTGWMEIEPKWNRILMLILLIGGPVVFLIGKEEFDENLGIIYLIFLIVFSISFLTGFLSLVFALTSLFSKKNRIGSFGITLAIIGFFCSLAQLLIENFHSELDN